MTPESQRKILDSTSQVFTDVGEALGVQASGYEEGIRFIREYGNKTVFELLLEIFKRAMPVGGGQISLTPSNIHGFLEMVDTRERAEAVLSGLPEPDPVQLEVLLKRVSSMLPDLRRVLLPFAKDLPYPAGGRRKKLPDPETRTTVRKEIGLLLADGVPLRMAQARLAQRNDVSLSTIQRIWREPRKQPKKPPQSLK
jgi:hypothetical protein